MPKRAAPVPSLPTFPGRTHGTLWAHAEDSSSPTFMPWTEDTFPEFLAAFEPLVLYLELKGIPLHIRPSPDFIAVAKAAKSTYSTGLNPIAWSMLHGVTWHAGAHEGGSYNAADVVADLEACGVPFSGILGSYDEASRYAGPITGLRTGRVASFDTLTCYGAVGHAGESAWAGIKSQGQQAVVLGGRTASFAHASPVARAVLAGTIPVGVVAPVFALGKRRDGKAGYCSVAYSAAKSGSGVSAKDAIEHSLLDAPTVKWTSVPALVALWRASGGGDAVYDAATIGKGGVVA